MKLSNCHKKINWYMKVQGFERMEKTDLSPVLKTVFPKDYRTCYMLLRKKYWWADEIVKKINASYSSSWAWHWAAYEKTESNKNSNKWSYVSDEYSKKSSSNSKQYKWQVQAQKPVSSKDDWWLRDFFMSWVWIIVLIFFVFVFWKLIRYILSFLYDIFNVNRLVYMKVTMPRLDSREDREIQKDLAKDMKEQIWRMAQVLRWVHKLWSLSVRDWIMSWLFDKAKIDLMYKYKNWEISFIVWTYPEYKNALEANISAQYSSSIVETISWLRILWAKKFTDIIPLKFIKNSVYPIRTFRQLEDDPINNILDTLSKMSWSDEVTILMTLRPDAKNFNRQAKVMADKLYRKEVEYDQKFKFHKLFTWPIDFIINGASNDLIKKTNRWNSPMWDQYTRMTKAEEEAINTMWEEAWKPAFSWNMFLISSSDNKLNNDANLQSLISAYTIYKDEYNNGLDQPEVLADIFWFFFIPLWKFSASFSLVWFFARKCIFTINEIASLYHFPMAVFNRASWIVRAEYKMTEPPKSLPVPTDANWRIITWIVAEKYRWWKVSEIFRDVKHPNIWEWIVAKYEKNEEWKTEEKKEKKIGIKLYKDAILLWISVYKNQYKPVYMKRKDRTRHHYIIWKSGWGKSVYIWALARQDIWNGDGVCVIDPHWDLVEDIMNFVPKERAKDVIYFDAWNEKRPMWLNLYEIASKDQADRVVNDATEIFIKMFGNEIFGPRIQEYFKYWSLTLLEDMEEWATLLDVPRLFTDEWYREYKIPKVSNPTVRNFREKTYNAMGDREKQEIIPYFTSKFVSFNTNSLIRNIIWQTKSAFNFRESMDNQKIILINLSKGMIWELNAQLLGMIVVSQIYNAAMSRANIAEKDRKDFYLYVDEFQNFVSWTFADILSEARKYKLALIMAHQYIAQLEWEKWEWGKSSVKDAVFGNAGTLQSFKVGAPDAEFLEKEYSPVLTPQDIVWIANFKTYLKLNIDNSTSRVFNVATIYTNDYENKHAWEVLKQYSAKKYGRDVRFVNEEIIARLWFADTE